MQSTFILQNCQLVSHLSWIVGFCSSLDPSFDGGILISITSLKEFHQASEASYSFPAFAWSCSSSVWFLEIVSEDFNHNRIKTNQPIISWYVPTVFLLKQTHTHRMALHWLVSSASGFQLEQAGKCVWKWPISLSLLGALS